MVGIIPLVFVACLVYSVRRAIRTGDPFPIFLTWGGVFGFICAVVGLVFLIEGHAVMPERMPSWAGLVLFPVGTLFVIACGALGYYRPRGESTTNIRVPTEHPH